MLEVPEPAMPPAYEAAVVPVGFNAAEFRAVVISAATVARSERIMPTAELIQKTVLRSYPMKLIKKIMATAEFSGEMTRQGIYWNEKEALSDKQLIALSLMADPGASGNLQTRLRRAGVSTVEYANWKRNPLFAAHVRRMTLDVLSEYEDEINVALVNGALDGKLEHIKFIAELSGKFSPEAKTKMDVQKIVMGILEVIMKHVTNPETLSAISREILTLANGEAPAPSFIEQYKELNSGNVH